MADTLTSGSFNIHIPLTKGTATDQLIGLASTTSVDRDEERMSQKALEDMRDGINTHGVNLFGNHEHSWENTLGVIKEASLTGDKLGVKINLDDPMTNPKVQSLIRKLEKGIKLGLSVGGKVTSTFTSYDKKTNKRVKTIDGVQIYEVSVVGIPSNADAFVALPSAIAKSMKETRWEDAENDCPACYGIMQKGSCRQCLYKEAEDDPVPTACSMCGGPMGITQNGKMLFCPACEYEIVAKAARKTSDNTPSLEKAQELMRTAYHTLDGIETDYNPSQANIYNALSKLDNAIEDVRAAIRTERDANKGG